jgi:hypothetical protein
MSVLGFASSLKHLHVNACILKEKNSENWGADQPNDDKIF